MVLMTSCCKNKTLYKTNYLWYIAIELKKPNGLQYQSFLEQRNWIAPLRAIRIQTPSALNLNLKKNVNFFLPRWIYKRWRVSRQRRKRGSSVSLFSRTISRTLETNTFMLKQIFLVSQKLAQYRHITEPVF